MKTVNSQQKEKILQESYEEGCVITELGRKYGVSEKTIYGWRRRNIVGPFVKTQNQTL